jgi:hypothetical protein
VVVVCCVLCVVLCVVCCVPSAQARKDRVTVEHQKLPIEPPPEAVH